MIAAQADEIIRLKGGPTPAEYQIERHGEGDRAEAGQARPVRQAASAAAPSRS
jgi:hypothetical protein